MKAVILELSNQECEALCAELPHILKNKLIPKLAGQLSDRADSATPAYRVLSTLLRQVETHLRRLESEEHLRSRSQK